MNNNNVNNTITDKFDYKKSLRLTSDQWTSLNLNHGANKVTFTVTTRLQVGQVLLNIDLKFLDLFTFYLVSNSNFWINKYFLSFKFIFESDFKYQLVELNGYVKCFFLGNS